MISFGVAHAHSGNYLNFTSGRRRRGSASPNLKVPNIKKRERVQRLRSLLKNEAIAEFF